MVVILIIFLAVMYIALYPIINKIVIDKSTEKFKNQIYEIAKDEISKDLKSPSTAKFSEYYVIQQGKVVDGRPDNCALLNKTIDIDQKITDEEDAFYSITIDVDAQNSYGAMLRKTFKCDIQPHKADTWCTDIEMYYTTLNLMCGFY